MHDLWPSPGMVHYIYIFGGLLPNSFLVQVLHSAKLEALLHGTPAAGSAKLCGVVQGMELRNFHRGRHLYSAGRPSRWESTYILVVYDYYVFCVLHGEYSLNFVDVVRRTYTNTPFKRYNRFHNRLYTRYSRLSNRLSNGFDNRLNVCIHDTTGCKTGLTTGLTTGCIV